MDMEATTEEFMGSSNNDVSRVLVKGKRTKRLRPSSPCGVATVTSSSSSASADHVSCGGDYGSFSSTTTAYESTEEEEDMAKCLILLARGGDGYKEAKEDHGGKTEKVISGRKFADMAAVCAATGKVGFYVYECKTCNRTFPSFQALGGHRASHKKPKTAVEEKKPPTPPGTPPQPLQQDNYEFEEGEQSHGIKSTQISLQLGSNKGFNNNKTKIHECSICGSEFTSGQALGGHMRRHRASTSTSSPVVDAAAIEVKPRNILEWDLNLPAPEDDVRDTEFEFKATQKSLMLSAPALVGCHY